MNSIVLVIYLWCSYIGYLVKTLNFIKNLLIPGPRELGFDEIRIWWTYHTIDDLCILFVFVSITQEKSPCGGRGTKRTKRGKVITIIYNLMTCIIIQHIFQNFIKGYNADFLCHYWFILMLCRGLLICKYEPLWHKVSVNLRYPGAHEDPGPLVINLYKERCKSILLYCFMSTHSYLNDW